MYETKINKKSESIEHSTLVNFGERDIIYTHIIIHAQCQQEAH